MRPWTGRTSVSPPMATTTQGTAPLSRIPEDRPSSLELVRITEAAAIAAAHWMGHGDNNSADQAAVEAMRRSMEDARFNGRIVIGEGERDEAPMLYIGEKVGRGDGPEVDIAVDPLEGTNPVAKGRPNAIAVMAVSEPGGLLHAPDTYMEKLVVGPPARGGRDRTRELAETRLPIDATLAGDDQAGAFQVLREVDGTQHEVRARHEAGVEEREESRTKPTRRARPGHVPDRTADKALDHVGVARERAVELGDDLGRRALLRTVDRGRSFGAEEWIANVAGDLDRRSHQPRVGLPVDTREARERGAALR